MFFHFPARELRAAAKLARPLGDYQKYLFGITLFRNMYWTVFPFETMLSEIVDRFDRSFAGCEPFMILAIAQKASRALLR
jgi:hypothetical protein